MTDKGYGVLSVEERQQLDEAAAEFYQRLYDTVVEICKALGEWLNEVLDRVIQFLDGINYEKLLDDIQNLERMLDSEDYDEYCVARTEITREEIIRRRREQRDRSAVVCPSRYDRRRRMDRGVNQTKMPCVRHRPRARTPRTKERRPR